MVEKQSQECLVAMQQYFPDLWIHKLINCKNLKSQKANIAMQNVRKL